MRIPGRPSGGLVFGKNWCIWKVARSSRKFAYGVYRSENRALAFVRGPTILGNRTFERVGRIFAEKCWNHLTNRNSCRDASLRHAKKAKDLVLGPRAIVSVIITAVAERDFVSCVLVGVVTGVTTSALSVADVVITLVPHHRKVITLVNGVFQSTLARNGGVRVVGAIPAINRAMNVLFHLTFPRFLFGHWVLCNGICRTEFHRCGTSKSYHISSSS